MSQYRAVPNQGVSDITIEARDGDNFVPVAQVFTIDPDFPLPKDAVARNLASILNGNQPLHDLDGGKNEFYYCRMGNETGGTLDMRCRHNGEGVSRAGGLLITVSDKASTASGPGAAFWSRLDADVMKNLCGAIDYHREKEVAPPPNKQTPPTLDI